MKNLFKNLMLVAVAAMAFTACTETNDEVNAVAKKTVINGVAVIDTDDTRSGFTGKEGDVYKSAWDSGETIAVHYNNAVYETKIADVEGHFTLEVDGELADNSFVTICSPAAAWNGSNIYCTVPTTQTPRANSVDPAAHILQAQNATVSNGSLYAEMQHAVAYGKMTVNTPAEFVIDYVEVEFKGTTYGYDNQLNYTINADNVEGNVFWFATDVINVAGFTVTAYNAEGNAYTKSVTIPEGRELNFQMGRVGSFSVSELTEQEAPKFTSAYTSNISSYHDFYMYFEDSTNQLSKLQLNPYYAANTDLTFTPGTYYIKGSSNNFYNGEYSTYDGTYLYGGTINISVVDRQYHFEFINLTDSNGNVVLEYATYTGPVVGLNVPDFRTPLTMPVPTAEKTGDLTATISWPAVENAVGYKVACNCGIDTTITERSIDLTFPEYGTHYVFVTALAAEDDANYKNSDTAVATLNLKDPNILADYIMDAVVWDASGERFKFTNAAQYPSYVYIRFNASDIPGNNSIKVGEYKGAGLSNGTTTVPEGQFTARVGWDMWTIDSWGTFTSSTTVNVSFADNAYTIILTDAIGKTFGYKGMPEGWVAPDGGGSEGGETTEPENPGEGGETSEDYTNWSYSAVLNTDTQIVTLTDKSGTGRVIELKLNEAAFAKFYGDPSKANYFTDVKVDGVAATATAESWCYFYRSSYVYNAEIDMTINGVHYSGVAESFSF